VNLRTFSGSIALFAALLAPRAPGHGEAPRFVAHSYATGDGPLSGVLIDLDGDGKPDLATADGTSNTVSVLLNDGQGGFAHRTSYPIGIGLHPNSIAAGDLDGDGNADLVAADDGSNTVTVLLGIGRGRFASAVNRAAFFTPVSIAMADFDGDGKLDVLVANAELGAISLLRGDGHGGLGLPTSFAVGGTPMSLACADLNGDGAVDVVTSNFASGSMSILLGDGHGRFGAPSTIRGASWFSPACVAIGEMNGDHALDLVAANVGSSSIAVLVGDGHGGFALPASPHAVSSGARSVAIGDLNGDGANDAAAPDYFSDGISVLLGDGEGGFTSTPTYPSTFGAPAIVIGDVNGDGKPDLVIADGSASVSVLLNLGTGSPFFGFCYGDGASSHPCPCGNEGVPGRGCDNSATTGGARLVASGVPSFSSDTVELASSGELPSTLSIVLQGRGVVSPLAFGGGLRCAGGLLERLYVEHASGGTVIAPPHGAASISARSAALGDSIPLGASRVYQVYYRDANLTFCAAGFNATNATSIAWTLP